MIDTRTTIALGVAVSVVAVLAGANVLAQRGGGAASFYDLKTQTLLGKPADLADYRGTVTLVVNVASYCGYTPQYKGLEQLHRELKGKGFAVLGFPSNDFGEQEPGTVEEIATFCRLTYDVTFPMFAKVVTRPGPASPPSTRCSARAICRWNFATYLVGGTARSCFLPSDVNSGAPVLRNAICRCVKAAERSTRSEGHGDSRQGKIVEERVVPRGTAGRFDWRWSKSDAA